MNISETIQWFEKLYKANKTSNDKKEFVCSASNDTSSIEGIINSDNFIGLTKCDTEATAQKTLNNLSKLGFNVIEPSKIEGSNSFFFVYMLKSKTTTNKN